MQEKLKEKDQELETIRERPDQEKEREIQRLRFTLADSDRTQATRAVLCNSLSEEAEQLKAKLGATMQVCQELLERLDEEKSKTAMTDQRTEANEVCRGNSAFYNIDSGLQHRFWTTFKTLYLTTIFELAFCIFIRQKIPLTFPI